MELSSTRSGLLELTPRRTWRLPRPLRNTRILLGGTVVLILVILAIGAPVIAPYSPYKADFNGAKDAPSWHHLLGQDQIGRDLLSRAMYGARTALYVGSLVVVIAVILGVLIGTTGGLAGGWTDRLIGAFVDMTFAFPG